MKLRPSLPASQLDLAFHGLLRQLDLYKENWISAGSWKRARELCRDVDPDDAAHVALALEINAPLWTGDRKLRRGLEARGFDRFFSPDQE